MTFDPTQYFMKINGKDYLPVQWRLVWLRDSYPLAQIETELVQHQHNKAVFRARVTLPFQPVVDTATGEILDVPPYSASATGWGSEEAADFGDYLEKAETKAIGRALGALGFGTQFSPDFDEQHRIVDSPQRPAPPNAPPQQRQQQSVDGRKTYPTPNQLPYAIKAAEAIGLNWNEHQAVIIANIHGKPGPLYRNDEYQDVYAWMQANVGENIWVQDGRIVMDGPPDDMPPHMTDPREAAVASAPLDDFDALDDVPF